MKNVLAPVEPPYSPEIAKVLSQYPQGSDGYIIKLFRVFANSRRFLTQKGVVNLLDKESPLTLREREIVILRVTANNDCEYEWGVHVNVFSKHAKLTDEQVIATRLGKGSDECWTSEDALLIRCVDDLCAYSKVLDENFDGFCEQWDLTQQLEILALCGNYHTISFVANSARIEIEPGAPRFPS